MIEVEIGNGPPARNAPEEDKAAYLIGYVSGANARLKYAPEVIAKHLNTFRVYTDSDNGYLDGIAGRKSRYAEKEI